MGRNDVVLIGGFTAALFISFAGPLSNFLDYVREIEATRGLHLLPALFILATIALTLLVSAPAHAQAPFKEGPVVEVSYIRTEPGQFDEYMRYVFGDYARLQNALKEAGIGIPFPQREVIIRPAPGVTLPAAIAAPD